MPVVDLVHARDVRDEVGIVTCPNCRLRMRPVFIKPGDGEEDLAVMLTDATAGSYR